MSYIGKTPTPVPLTSSDIVNGIVTGEKLNADVISSQTALAVAPADTDEFLISDAGVLKRLDASLIGGGKVLQVISTTKTDTFSTSGNSSFVDVTGLSAAITPSSSSNKILVLWNLEIGHSATGNSMLTRLLRGSTAISIGDAASNRQRALTAQTSAYSNTNNTTRGKAGSFLDSPSSTSATTYKLQIFSDGGTVYCNRDGAYDDQTYAATGTSTITVMEIGA